MLCLFKKVGKTYSLERREYNSAGVAPGQEFTPYTQPKSADFSSNLKQTKMSFFWLNKNELAVGTINTNIVFTPPKHIRTGIHLT